MLDPCAFDNSDGRFDDPDSDVEAVGDGRFDDPDSDVEDEGPLLPYFPGADPDGDLLAPESFEELFGDDNDDDGDEGPLLPYAPGADPDGDLPEAEPLEELLGEDVVITAKGGSAATTATASAPGAAAPGAAAHAAAAPTATASTAAVADEEADAERRRELNRKKRQKQKAKKLAGKPSDAASPPSSPESGGPLPSSSFGGAPEAVELPASPDGGAAKAEAGSAKGMSRHQRRLQMQQGGRAKGSNKNEAVAAPNPDLFVDQLKLLPFLLKASHSGLEGQEEVLEHAVASARDGTVVRLSQYPHGVGCAATAGKAAWSWRVWDAAKAIARVLEEPELLGIARDAVVLELGAGAGLSSLVAAKLGARAILATDLPRALPLLIHNLERNGCVEEDECPRTAGGVCCPSGHPLKRIVAKTEDHVCNVCGLADPLGAGIEQGAFVHICRTCDFDVCGRCNTSAAGGEWGMLPGWFALQCEGAVLGMGTWRLDDRESPCLANPTAADSPGSPGSAALPLVMVTPWDLLGTDVTSQAEALVKECVARTGAAPSLVLVADVSCSAALIQPLVNTLVALRALLPRGAIALMAHERREAKVDSHLEVAMEAAELRREPLAIPSGVQSDEDAARGRLRLWRLPLSQFDHET